MKACLCIHCNDHVYIVNRSIQEKFLENSFHGESAVTLLEEQQPKPIRIQPSFLINNCKYPVSIVKRREESSLELVGTEENTAPIFAVSFMRYTFSSKEKFLLPWMWTRLFVCLCVSISFKPGTSPGLGDPSYIIYKLQNLYSLGNFVILLGRNVLKLSIQ